MYIYIYTCVYICIYIYVYVQICIDISTDRRSFKKLPKSSLGQQYLVDSGEFVGQYKFLVAVVVNFIRCVSVILLNFWCPAEIWGQENFKNFDHLGSKFLSKDF